MTFHTGCLNFGPSPVCPPTGHLRSREGAGATEPDFLHSLPCRCLPSNSSKAVEEITGLIQAVEEVMGLSQAVGGVLQEGVVCRISL